MTGRFYGVGLGPGDPELITLKAARLIASADVIAYHAGVGKQSNARRIAADLIPAGAIEEELRYPVTTGRTDHPGGYAGAMAEFYEQSAARLAAHLEAGRTVVLLAEGDPLFYGSYMYMHDRLSQRFPTEVVPGVPAFAAATAAVASPLVRQTDVLTILPGTLPEPELARRLADTDGAIIMKLGRTFPAVRSALEQAGRLEHALYVERASMPVRALAAGRRRRPGDGAVLLADRGARRLGPARGRGRSTPVGDQASGRGPRRPSAASGAAGRRARARARRVDDPRGGGRAGGGGPRGRLRAVRQPGAAAGGADSGTPRATPSRWTARGSRSTWRRAGERVAVVSGGDAGVFGMASAVFEAAEDPAYADVSIRVLPGPQRRPGGGRAGRCADRRGLRGGQPLRPAQAVVGGRAAAARDRRGRPGAGDLQPGLAVAHRAGRCSPRSSCSSTARRTPWSWSAATSAGRRSR